MKEAIKRLRSIGERGMAQSDYREVDDSLALYRQDLELVLHTPTVDEVCKAYCDYFHCPLTYNNITKSFEEIKGGRARGRIIARLFIDKVDIPHKLPIHLITMIGRFYEGLEE